MFGCPSRTPQPDAASIVDPTQTTFAPAPANLPANPPAFSNEAPTGAFTLPTVQKPTNRRERDKVRSKVNKKRKRKPLADAREVRLPQAAKVVVDLPVKTLKSRAAHGGYVARGGVDEIAEILTMAEVEAMGHLKIEWNGW